MQCCNPITIGKEKGKGIHVPCGTCLPCLRNKRRDWYFRIEQEQKDSTNSYFITLTYEDENIPIRNSFPSLLKSDVQYFINKLRKYQERYWEKETEKANAYTKEYVKTRYKIRYFAVGEYGKRGDRPHYHIILFNVATKIMETINHIWDKGFVHIGEVNTKSIKYATKYIIGKEGPGEEDAKHEPQRGPGIEKPFSLMSTRPGIGECYLTPEIIDYHRKKYQKEKGEIPLVKTNEGYFMKMPAYYKNKIFDSDAERHFRKTQIEKGDEITNEDWEKAYKIYGQLAEEKLIEKFEYLNSKLKSQIKRSETL